MNRNALSGLLGITLLAFGVAFLLGRINRPVPSLAIAASPVAISSLPSQPSSLLQPAPDDLLSSTEAAAYQEEEPAPPLTPRAAIKPATKASAKPQPKLPRKPKPAAVTTLVKQAPPARSVPAAPAPNATATDTAARPAATEPLAPKPVTAKDFVAIEERQNYAALLPNELLTKGVQAKVSLVGEQSEVIILSSPSFDANSKDTVIKQVCIDLKALGFKRVHITDGGDYSMNFSL